MTKSEEIEKALFEYLEKHKETATSNRYRWIIGKLEFWVANEVYGLKMEGEFTVPVPFETERLKERVWDYYVDWCQKYYVFELPSDEQNGSN